MKMDSSWYKEWYWTQATPDEKQLIDKIGDFESLFEDMLFQPGTSTYELIQCKSKLQGSDEWIDDEIDLPDELAYFSYTFFHFKVEPLNGCAGAFSHPDQTLTVTPEALENDSTILHEMIHLHEYVINDLPMYFHDMVYWALYKDLKKKIPELDNIITGHAHLLTGSTIYSAGGLHDILFLLKSFDLDIRMGYSLGTVFAYGRDEELKNYSYNKDTEREACFIPDVDIEASLKRLKKEKKRIQVYTEIMSLRDEPENPVFQRKYDAFYRVRRNDRWREEYFRLMGHYQERGYPCFGEILLRLFQMSNRIEASFASKMLATLDDNMPIWDTNVMTALQLRLTGITQEIKMSMAVVIYDRIYHWYQAFLKTEEAKTMLHRFDEAFPEFRGISNTKKIDFILWQSR